MSIIRALLIGLGHIGCGYDLSIPFQTDQVHSGRETLTHARALQCHPRVDLVAAIDPLRQARLRFEEIYPINTFPDLASWISSDSFINVDLVVVAVPPFIQPDVVDEILSHLNPRLLLLEKPVAIDLQQCERLLSSCAKYPNVSVAVNYIRRYLPVVQEVRDLIVARKLGDLVHSRLMYGKGLLTNGSHFVNLAEYWLGPFSLLQNLCDCNKVFSFDTDSSLLLSSIHHPPTSFIVHSLSNSHLIAGELDLWFTNGRIRWDNDGSLITVWQLEYNQFDDYHPLSTPYFLSTEMEHYQHFVIDSLVNHILHPCLNPLKCSLLDGLQTLKTLLSS